jgi:fructose transport system ATP-binding protein
MRRQAAQKVADLGITTVQDITQAVETLSGGQRQAVAVARAAAFDNKVLIMDGPTAALGASESSYFALKKGKRKIAPDVMKERLTAPA